MTYRKPDADFIAYPFLLHAFILLLPLKVNQFDGKGRGVVATKPFKKEAFVVEYQGNLLDIPTAKAKDAEYSKNPKHGSYMFYFKVGEIPHW